MKYMKYVCICMYFIKNTYIKYLYIIFHPPQLPVSISIYYLKLFLDLITLKIVTLKIVRGKSKEAQKILNV